MASDNLGAVHTPLPGMLYIVQTLTVAMFAYMMWLLLFRLRLDRVSTERERSRGKFAFRPKDRLRFLLNKSFGVSEQRPDWEEMLIERIAEVVPATDTSSNQDPALKAEKPASR